MAAEGWTWHRHDEDDISRRQSWRELFGSSVGMFTKGFVDQSEVRGPAFPNIRFNRTSNHAGHIQWKIGDVRDIWIFRRADGDVHGTVRLGF